MPRSSSGKDYEVWINIGLDTKGVKTGQAELDRLLANLSRGELSRTKKLHADQLRDAQKHNKDQVRVLSSGARDVAKEYERQLGRGFFSKLAREASSAFKSSFSIGGIGGGGGGGLGGIIGGALSVAGGNLITSVVSGVTSQITGAIKTGFDFNKIKEQTLLGFEIKLKGRKEAEDFFAQIAKFAQTSEQELPQVLDSVQRLMSAFDAPQAMQSIKAITDRVAATGKTGGEAKDAIDGIALALQQVIYKNRLAGQEVVQLAERQVNAYKYIAEEIGKTDQSFAALSDEERVGRVTEMAEKGMLNAKASVAIIIRGMEKEFGGTSARIARETLAGIESNTSDRVAQLAGKSTQTAFEQYKDFRTKVLNLLNSPVGDKAAGGIDAVVGQFTKGMDATIGAMRSGDMSALGFSAVGSVATGAAEAGKSLFKAGVDAAGQLVGGIEDRLDMHSPSQVMIGLGENAGMSFQQGFAKAIGDQKSQTAFRRWTQEQIENARKIVEIGRQIGATEKQIRAAMSTGIVESRLRNLNYGDRDSLGLMQQRPSQGWGTKSQVTNVDYAIRKFYEVAMSVSQKGTVGQLAQRVQRSGFPRRYDQELPGADQLYSALSGASGGAWRGGSSSQPVKVEIVGRNAFGGSGDDLYSRRAASSGEELRGLVAERDTNKTALNDLMQDAQKRLRWAEALPQGTERERVIRERMMYGATETIAAIQRDLDDFLNGINEQIAKAQDRLKDAVMKLGTDAPSGDGFTDWLQERGLQGRDFNEHGSDAERRGLQGRDQGEHGAPLDLTRRGGIADVFGSAGAVAQANAEYERFTKHLVETPKALQAIDKAAADAFGNLPPLINTAAAEAKEEAKEFNELAKDIAGAFGGSFELLLRGKPREAMRALREDWAAMLLGMARDWLQSSIFDLLNGKGANGGGGLLGSLGKLFGIGGNRASGSTGNSGGTVAATPPDPLVERFMELLNGGSNAPAPPPSVSAAGGNFASRALAGVGLGGSSNGSGAAAPRSAAATSLFGSLSGLAGSALPLLAAQISFSTWQGALSGQIAPGARALLGGGLLGLGLSFIGRSRLRRREEGVRNQATGDTRGRLLQILQAVQTDQMDGAAARDEIGKLHTQWLEVGNSLKDSKTRRHHLATWAHFQPIISSIESAISGQAVRANARARMSPVFAEGGGVWSAPAGKDGGTAHPAFASKLGLDPFGSGLVPGAHFDKKDDRLIRVSKREVVLTPDVWQPITPYLKARKVRGFEGFESGGAVDAAAISAMMPTTNDSAITVNLAFNIKAGGGDDVGERIVEAVRKSLASDEFSQSVVHAVRVGRMRKQI